MRLQNFLLFQSNILLLGYTNAQDIHSSIYDRNRSVGKHGFKIGEWLNYHVFIRYTVTDCENYFRKKCLVHTDGINLIDEKICTWKTIIQQWKKLRKMELKDILCSWTEWINIVKTCVLPKWMQSIQNPNACMVNSLTTKEPRIYNGVFILFSINDGKETRQPKESIWIHIL